MSIHSINEAAAKAGKALGAGRALVLKDPAAAARARAYRARKRAAVGDDGVPTVMPDPVTVDHDARDASRDASVTQRDASRPSRVTDRDVTAKKPPSRGHSANVTVPPASVTVPVDLDALREDIKTWAHLRAKVRGLQEAERKGKAPFNPRFVFFLVGVAFYGLIAAAAIGGAP